MNNNSGPTYILHMALVTQEEMNHELETVRQYLKRRTLINSEIAVLKEDLKVLDEEFKEKLDMKTLKHALSVAKTRNKVAHRFTFDSFLEVLEDEGWVEKGI